jgi:hypothetical protein
MSALFRSARIISPSPCLRRQLVHTGSGGAAVSIRQQLAKLDKSILELQTPLKNQLSQAQFYDLEVQIREQLWKNRMEFKEDLERLRTEFKEDLEVLRTASKGKDRVFSTEKISAAMRKAPEKLFNAIFFLVSYVLAIWNSELTVA